MFKVNSAYIFCRFVFVTPSVISPGPSMRVSHPSPSQHVHDEELACRVKEELNPVLSQLNSIQMHMTIQFPELRLIQYDCGVYFKCFVIEWILGGLVQKSHCWEVSE